MPPESPDEPCALPFSIRSFVRQASQALGGCQYATAKRGAELEGYEGIRIRRDDGGYLQPVKGLIERFDPEMREAGDDP